MSGVLKPNEPIRGRVVAKEVLLVGDKFGKETYDCKLGIGVVTGAVKIGSILQGD